ncbi:MAG: hypothetical protein [Microvirus sp.]|nr:MAG: hypothetical protein [Microvirus sp.]
MNEQKVYKKGFGLENITRKDENRTTQTTKHVILRTLNKGEINDGNQTHRSRPTPTRTRTR